MTPTPAWSRTWWTSAVTRPPTEMGTSVPTPRSRWMSRGFEGSLTGFSATGAEGPSGVSGGVYAGAGVTTYAGAAGDATGSAAALPGIRHVDGEGAVAEGPRVSGCAEAGVARQSAESRPETTNANA